MPTEDLQNSDSQTQTSQTESIQSPETASTSPLNDAQMKSGMLDAINTELDTPKPEKKSVEKTEEVKQGELKLDEQKPEIKSKPVKKEEKKAEDDPYGMPEGLQKDSQKRFTRLVEIAKEATAKVQEIEKTAKDNESTIVNFRSILEETKTSPDDLNNLLEYNRMVKTGNLEGALQLLDEQRSIIARYLGRPLEGVDYLDGYNDLKQELQEGKITPERAAEIAKSRNIGTVLRQQNEHNQRINETQAEHKKQIDTALENISKFAAEKANTDIDYKKKEEILLKAVDRISSNFPPHLWLSQVEMLYDTLNSMPASQPTPSITPLRPNSGSGGNPQAKTMFDAISNGIGYGTN